MASNTPVAAASKSPTSFSCVRCFERKVKCDRQQPCGACHKHSTECIYRVPPPPRRRKKRAQEELLTERLKQYEQALQQQGIDPKDVVKNSAPAPRNENRSRQGSDSSRTNTPRMSDSGASTGRRFATSHLIYDQGRSSYVENHLWNRVTEEISSPQDALNVSSDDDNDSETQPDDGIEYMLAWTPSMNSPRSAHPSPDHISSLWHIYLQNVHPISMIIHRPTLQISIRQAACQLDRVSKPMEALMFAIYAAAVFSLKDTDCEYQFGETREALLERYRKATKIALCRAKFFGTQNLVVLQAFLIHVLAMREEYDARTLWVCTGIALRIAEGMGLHRDGTVLGLPPFETEMRRRLWWQLSMTEFQTAELIGARKFKNLLNHDNATQPPLNINDEDIYPGMEHPPLPERKATEMMFCSLRYFFGCFWSRKANALSSRPGQELGLWDNYEITDDIEFKDKAIDELQQLVQAQFVDLCDPSDPVQFMTSLLGTGAPRMMKMVVHHPRRYPKDEDLPEHEQRLLWSLSLQTLEMANTCHTNRKLQGFRWHTSFYFQWQPLIYVLDQLHARPNVRDAEKAWSLVHEIYENYPAFVTNTKKPIHVAVGNLCLKAYAARELALANEGITMPLKPPEYISRLRAQRADASRRSVITPSTSYSEPKQQTSTSTPGVDHVQGYNYPNIVAVPPSMSLVQSQFSPMNTYTPPSTDTTHAMWPDNFGFQAASQHTPNMGFVPHHGTYEAMTGADTTMDWSQWDNLINNFGVSG